MSVVGDERDEPPPASEETMDGDAEEPRVVTEVVYLREKVDRLDTELQLRQARSEIAIKKAVKRMHQAEAELENTKKKLRVAEKDVKMWRMIFIRETNPKQG